MKEPPRHGLLPGRPSGKAKPGGPPIGASEYTKEVVVCIDGDEILERAIEISSAGRAFESIMGGLLTTEERLTGGKIRGTLLYTGSRWPAALRDKVKSLPFDEVMELKLKQSSYALASSTTGERVQVEVASALEANISMLLMEALLKPQVVAVVLLAKLEEFRYPLSRLRTGRKDISVYVADFQGTKSSHASKVRTTEESSLGAFCTHAVHLNPAGEICSIEEVDVSDCDITGRAPPLTAGSKVLKDAAVLVDGSFARTVAPMDAIVALPSLLHDMDKAVAKRVGRKLFVDSPLGSKTSEELKAAGYDLLLEPWHSVKESNARCWGAIRQSWGTTAQSDGGSRVRVRRQCGVDSSVAALIFQLALDPSVRLLILFTGDRDFADTVRRALSQRRLQCSKRGTGAEIPLEVRIITFFSPVHEDLVAAAGGEKALIDLSEPYREAGFAESRCYYSVARQSDRELMTEILAWKFHDVTDPRLLVADFRLRPRIPDMFSDEEEYSRTFVGYLLEEIRQEAANAIEVNDPSRAYKVSALDGQRVNQSRCTELCEVILYVAETEEVEKRREDDDELVIPLITDQLLLFSSLNNTCTSPIIGPDSVLALTRSFRGRPNGTSQVFMHAIFHRKYKARMQALLDHQCYLMLLGTVLSHRRALRGMARTRLPPTLRSAILAQHHDHHHSEKSSARGTWPAPSAMPGLDDSQRSACHAIVHSSLPITLVHGPPGTGKTRTLVMAILQLLSNGARVLACAPTNVALLHLAGSVAAEVPEELRGSIVLVVDEDRLKQAGDVPEALKSMMLGARLNQDGEGGYRSKAAGVISRSRLVFTTVATAGRSEMIDAVEDLPFDVCLLDEASMICEAHTLTVLQLKPGRLVLAGDPKQLPSVVHSPLSRKGLLSRSLMERLMDVTKRRGTSAAVPVFPLLSQYRMHPHISHFPFKTFYHDVGQLTDGIASKDAVAPWHKDKRYPPYVFLSFGGKEHRGGLGMQRSTGNVSEAMVVVTLVANFLKEYKDSCTKGSIAIIAPYRAQVAATHTVIQERCPGYADYMTVRTVDDVQGQEIDIVVISATRANDEGRLGFLNDDRRLNVSITRSRRGLWIVGDHQTLCGGGDGPHGDGAQSTWPLLVEDARMRDKFVDIDGVVTPEALQWLGHGGLSAKAAMLKDGPRMTLEELNKIFAGAIWPLEITQEFLNGVGAAFFQGRRCASTKAGVAAGRGVEALIMMIGRLSTGALFSKKYRGSRIMELKVPGTEYEMMASVVIDEQRKRQLIKIWSLVEKHGHAKAGVARRLIQRSLRQKEQRCPWYSTACDVWVDGPEGGRVPRLWESAEAMSLGIKEVVTAVSAADEQVEDGEEEEEEEEDVGEDGTLALTKSYLVNSINLYNTLVRGSAPEDMKLKLTGTQHQCMAYPHSIIVVGRSGTGKTTVAIRRALFEQKKFKHNAALQKKDSTSGVDKGAAGENEEVSVRQLFLTASPHLSSCLQRAYRRLSRSDKPLAERDWDTEEGEDDDLLGLEDLDRMERSGGGRDAGGAPSCFLDLGRARFPVFLTCQALLEMLDCALLEPFLKADKEERREQQRCFITGRDFIERYYPHIDHNLTRGILPGKVWTQIVSHIKGSFQAARHGHPVEEDLYLALVRAAAEEEEEKIRGGGRGERERRDASSTAVTAPEGAKIYAIFRAYERLRLDRKGWDLGDLVLHLNYHIHRKAVRKDAKWPRIDRVFVDEVQDLTEAAVFLLGYVCPDGRSGFFFGGDRAQTIQEGVSFKFESLKNFLFDMQRQCGFAKPLVPQLVTLTENKRTHQQVLDVANQVLQALRWIFPGDLDSIMEETSPATGPKPYFLTDQSPDTLMMLFKNASELQYGAQQVILVRDDAAKKMLLEGDRASFQGKVLTVREAKGLEFADVLVYDFFNCSALSVSGWRTLGAYLQELGAWKMNVGVPKEAERDPPRQLTEELRSLYVAMTRARDRLIVFDRDQDRRRPIYDLMAHLGLVETKWDLKESFFKEGTPQEWKERGNLMWRQMLFGDALACFQHAGDAVSVEKAKAMIAMEQGDKHEREGKWVEASECFRDASKIYEGLMQQEGQGDGKWRDAVERTARCCEKAGMHAAAATGYERLGMFVEAGRGWMAAGMLVEAARAFARGGQEEATLDACYRCRDLELAIELVWRGKGGSGGDGAAAGPSSDQATTGQNKRHRDKFVSRVAHRARREGAPDSEMARVLGLMSSKVAVRSFLTQREMWSELAQLNEDEGGEENLREAAELYERMSCLDKAVQCFLRLGHRKDVLRIRLSEARATLCPFSGYASLTHAGPRNTILSGITVMLVNASRDVAGSQKDDDVDEELKLWTSCVTHSSASMEQQLREPWSSRTLPHGGIVLALLTLARLYEEWDAAPVKKAKEEMHILEVALTVVSRLRQTVDVALTSLKEGQRDTTEFWACVEMGRPAGARGKADVECFVLTGALRLLSMAVELLASSDMAGRARAARLQLAADASGAKFKDEPKRWEITSKLCSWVVMEDSARTMMLEMIDLRKGVGNKVPERLRNGVKWQQSFQGVGFVSVQQQKADLDRLYHDVILQVGPSRVSSRLSSRVIARQLLMADSPFKLVVERALEAHYQASIHQLVHEQQSEKLDGPRVTIRLEQVARFLLVRDLFGIPPPAVARVRDGVCSTDIWVAFEWQRSLCDKEAAVRNQALKAMPFRMFNALSGPQLQALLACKDWSTFKQCQAAHTHYSLPTFLSLLERLTTHLVFICGAVGGCSPPLLPSNYVASYLTNQLPLIGKLIDYEDNRPPPNHLQVAIVDLLLRLLRHDSLLDMWSTISISNAERHKLQPLQVSCRTRCYVLLVTVLLNRVGFQWDLKRMEVMRTAFGLEASKARVMWAQTHPEWEVVRRWAISVHKTFVEPSEQSRTFAVQTKRVYASMATLLRDLGHEAVCMSFPWATLHTDWVPVGLVKRVECDESSFGREMLEFVGLKDTVKTPQQTAAKTAAPTSGGRRTGSDKASASSTIIGGATSLFRHLASADDQDDDDDPAAATVLPPAPSATAMEEEKERTRKEQERKEGEAKALEGVDPTEARRRAAEAFWAKKEQQQEQQQQQEQGGGGVESQGGGEQSEGVERGEGRPLKDFYMTEVMSLVEKVEWLRGALHQAADPDSEPFKDALSAANWADAASLETDIVEANQELKELSEGLGVEAFANRHQTVGEMERMVTTGRAVHDKVQEKMKALVKSAKKKKSKEYKKGIKQQHGDEEKGP